MIHVTVNAFKKNDSNENIAARISFSENGVVQKKILFEEWLCETSE